MPFCTRGLPPKAWGKRDGHFFNTQFTFKNQKRNNFPMQLNPVLYGNGLLFCCVVMWEGVKVQEITYNRDMKIQKGILIFTRVIVFYEQSL